MKPIAVALLALAFPTQVPKEPAKDLFLHGVKAPGLEVRFVDYHWQPALFEAMEKPIVPLICAPDVRLG